MCATLTAVLHLRALEFTPPDPLPARFPYSVPFVRRLERLDFAGPLTFLVGENGSGKSTFLETLACAVGSITVGSESVTTDPTLAAVRELAWHWRLTWSKRTKRGFFMRAEDFFGFAKKLAAARAEMEQDLRDIERDYQGRSETARGLARMPYARELGDLRRSYGEGLDSGSHGEAFIALFRARFTGPGLYLIDEPEAPLSPTRQLGFLALLKEMLDQGAQCVIATHSPILLAYPGAQILSFDGGRIAPAEYESLDHVITTRGFLNDPGAYLKHLLE
jgi:predicted ATPase